MELSNTQNEKITMFNHRRDFIAQPAIHTLFYDDPIVKAKILQTIATRILLDKATAQKLKDTSGDASQKSLTRDTVIKTIGNKARGCAVYFEENDLLDIAATLSKKKSYYEKLTSQDLFTVVSATRQILFDNEIPLTPYGINTAFFTLLDTQILKMSDWSTKPTSERQLQYAGDVEIDKYIIINDKQFDQLDSLVVNAFEESNPDDIAAFLKTGNQATVGVRHNIIAGSILLLPDSIAINRAKIDIIDTVTGDIVKTIFSDAHGLFEFNCQNKDFFAKATAEGCVTQQILFHPVYRGTFNLNFLMQPAPPIVPAP